MIREKGYRVKNLGRLKRGRARDVELLEDGRTMGNRFIIQISFLCPPFPIY